MENSFQLALAAGVNIALGSDAGVMPHADARFEFQAMVRRGMSPLQAIQSATINAADLLGVDDRGVIAEGLLADLIAVDGNPLQNIRLLESVSFVMQGGRLIKQP